MADDKPVEQHSEGGEPKLDGRGGDATLKFFDVGGDVHGLHIAKLVEATGLTPGSKVGGGLGVGSPGIGVSDIGGEELNDALGGRRIRGEQGREGDSLPRPDSGRRRSNQFLRHVAGLFVMNDNVLYHSHSYSSQPPVLPPITGKTLLCRIEPQRILREVFPRPAQPAWFHRLDEILATLRAKEPSHLDRLAVQKLFGVRERRARQIMAGLPGLRAGNASAVTRQALIARLEETAAGGLFQWEVSRRARVVEGLDPTRRQLAAHRVRISVGAGAEARRVRDLSGDIVLQPGELRIALFYGAEDLAAKLFELSQAMANDWPAFSQAAEE